MTRSFLGRFAVAAASGAFIATAACSSSSPVIPRAYVSVSLQRSSAMGVMVGNCEYPNFLQIGVPTSGNPGRINDGASQDGIVHVQCSVTPSGSGFNVQADATYDNVSAGGSFEIAGMVTSQGGTVSANFGSIDDGSYSGTGCTVTYEYQGMTGYGGVAAGKIWGHVDCPAAVDTSLMNSQCDASADFVFENCGS